MTVCATSGTVSSRRSAAAAAAKAGTPGVMSHGMPSSSRRRACSATALYTDRSPECRRGTSWAGAGAAGGRAGDVVAGRVSGGELGDDLVQRQVARVDEAGAGWRVPQDLGRDERAGVQAHPRGGDEPLGAEREQVGRAGAGADEVDHLVIARCTTVICARQPSKPPTG